MFAYCNNNPVNFYDPFGESFIGILTALDALAKVLIICVVAILVYQMVGTWLESSSISPSLSKGQGKRHRVITTEKTTEDN